MNIEKEIEECIKNAEAGVAEAQYCLGVMYRNGSISGAFEFNTAVQWFRKAADQDCASAQYALSDMYAYGLGVAENAAESLKWLRKAAECGHAEAQCNLGVCYENGDGVEQDASEACKWYLKSADQGYAGAQCFLADMYRYGRGVEQDDQKAVELYQQAAEQGFADAEYAMGDMYVTGRVDGGLFGMMFKSGAFSEEIHIALLCDMDANAEENRSQAAQWYRKAAEHGQGDAQYKLGVMLNLGKGVVRDDEESVKWLLQAADSSWRGAQLQQYAQCQLGEMYAEGYGVERDLAVATNWYRKSAENGCEEARNRLAAMTSTAETNLATSPNGQHKSLGLFARLAAWVRGR